MKNKSKMLLAFLAVLSVLSFSAACGSGSSESSATSDTTSSITSDETSDITSDETSDITSDETSDITSDETSDITSDETSDTASDETSDSSSVAPETYTVTFMADGKTVGTVEYTEENKEITEPEVPAKEHYNGEWEAYELEKGDVTVNAVYTAVEYTITFVADGQEVKTVTYTVEDEKVDEPEVPAKDGYGGAWEAYELNGGNKTVNAAYKAGVYTVTFKADGKTVSTAEYTVENKEITEPAVPAKEHYNGAWETYTLEKGDVTVNAVYTAVEYTVTFVADGEEVKAITYTVEDETIEAPAVPAKDGYDSAWEAYELNGGNKTVNAVYTAIKYTVTFVADGETVGTAEYTVKNKEITEPAVPAKEHYNGAWETYTLEKGDVTVNAVYTAVEYTVTFMADGEEVKTVTYTVEDETIEAPAVPAKDGYDSAWEAYELNGGNKTVNAVYTAIKYTVTFMADGEKVGAVEYTAENKEITEPAVPEKEGYSGVWEEYTLENADVTVNAVYTAVEYTVTFVADGEEVKTVTYTVEDETIEAPAVPAKDGYDGVWEAYELNGGNKTVNAVYTVIKYTVTFVADGETVGTAEYTVENKEITVPAVPEKEGYSGVWEEYTLDNGDKTVNANYTANTYQITYNANGGSANMEKQDVIYGEGYTLATATPSKSYQEFLGWCDENGKLVENGDAWNIAKDVTLTAKFSKGITFNSMTEVPSYITPHAERVNDLTLVEIESGNKVLQATSKESCTSDAGLYITTEFLDTIFADSDVEYMAFDIKTNGASTTNGAQYPNPAGGWIQYDPNQFNTAPTDEFKSYYFPRSVYENWVENNITSNRFIILGNMVVGGESFYIDNIRPVTADEYIQDFFSFEHGGVRLRKDGSNQPLFYLNTETTSGWQLGISNVDETKAKFTNEIVSDGIRAFQFTKYSGVSSILMCHFADTVMETAMRGAGYVSFDLYVPEGSDAKIVKDGQEWYGTLQQGWNTIYEKVDATANELIRFTDTTASTYVIDNFRLLTEEEYNKAMYGFEAGGVLRDNNSNDDTKNSGWMYYYAGWDKANNKASIQVSEGNGENDVATLSNVRFATEKTHSGVYSLAFDKKAGYMSLGMSAESAMYASMKNGFTFWIYSTTEIDGTVDNILFNGSNQKLNGGEGIKIQANTWTQITLTAEDINSTGRFLILQGATEGTIYIDDLQPLSVATAE